MRKLVYLAILIFVASCGSKSSGDFTISGVVSNLFSDEVTLFYSKNPISKELVETSAKLDENNAFTITIPITEAKMGFIRLGTTQIPLYLIPGGNLNVSYDALNFESEPVVTGKKAEETNFVLAFMKENQEKYGREWLFATFALEPQEFLAAINTAYEEKMSFLKDFKGYRKLDRTFRNMMETDFLFDKKIGLVNYPSYYGFLTQGGKPTLPDGYFDFLEDKKLFNDKHLNSQTYIAFINAVLEKKVMDKVDVDGANFDADIFFTEQFNIAKELLSGKTKEIAIASMMENIFGYGSSKLAREKYEEFNQIVTNEEYKEEIGNLFNATIALNPGQPAPDFTLTDIEGNKVSLSDFAGKVVYLDFWASWCGPCLQQIPMARELKKRMEGQDVVFLYVSLDEKEEDWKNKVKEENLQGIHLNAPGFKQEVAKLYNVSGVPTFFIIGRDGLIFDNRAPRPSEARIDDVLMAALEQ
jgi:thiol-disulfide isomerase/thioredoxin